MKRFVLLLITAFYLIASTGMVVCVHQYKRELVSVFTEKTGITHKHTHKSCCHHSQSSKKNHKDHKKDCPDGCCKNGVCLTKAKEEPSSFQTLSFKISKEILNGYETTACKLPVIKSIFFTVSGYRPPPHNPKKPLYLQYQSLLI